MNYHSKNYFKLLLILFLASTFFFFSCNETKKDTTENQSNESRETENVEESTQNNSTTNSTPVYLVGSYATSTKLPLKNFHLTNALDNNESTSWQTMQGAAPDEGMMLYLSEPTFIKELIIKTAKGNELAEIQKIILYTNGKKQGEFDVNSVLQINEEVSSIYLRISQTSAISTKNSSDNVSKTNSFDKNLSVGISEITAIGKNDDPLRFVAPLYIDGEIMASSTLEPIQAYSATHLFDSHQDISWAEGDANSGVGTKITFKFNSEQTISAIQIWNGYQRSEEHFKANARIKKFSFGTTGTMQEYSLEDNTTPQKNQLQTALSGNEFVLEIKEVYEGSKYKDLVVSEMRFYDNEKPILIQTKETENQITELKNKAKNTPLETVLDRRLNYQENDYYQVDKSFILRSDGTFVMYKTENSAEENSKSEILADGNWEIKEVNNDKVKIRVFGKFVDFSQYQDFYKGKVTKDFLQIFQDFVIIDNQKLKGEKFIGEFVY